MVDLTATLRKQLNQDSDTNFKVNQDRGVLVVQVFRELPCWPSRGAAGGHIQKIDGKPVQTASDVQTQVEASSIGSTLQVEVSRNGQVRTVQIKPAAFPTKTPGG
jgi:S1-C subfamily serine protease